MKTSLSLISLFTVVFLTTFSAFAQTEPYYQLPTERTEKGTLTFPNLKPLLTKIYFRAEGGPLISGNSLSNSINGQLQPENQLNVNWSLGVGYNYRDRWMIDIGYARTPMQLASTFSISPFTIPIRETFLLNSIPVRFQRSVWVVDRVARSTRLFIGGAVYVNTNGKAAEVSKSQEGFLRRFNAGIPPDTIRLAEITTFASTPIKAEASIELRGKLGESLEIGTYAKVMSSFSRPYQTEISFQVNSDPTILSIQ
ncbi:MAG: hypothetical protein NWP83_05610, partial [Spirosomaceae bacterium]|nr:hypothetical protein [Spirosomataceae bacterium]